MTLWSEPIQDIRQPEVHTPASIKFLSDMHLGIQDRKHMVKPDSFASHWVVAKCNTIYATNIDLTSFFSSIL